MAGALFAQDAIRQPTIDRPLSERQPLLIGTTSDSSPYGYIDEKGRWTGFAVDLFDAVARVMKLEIRRVALPGREQQERFRAGEFDALQQFSQTADREAYTEFSVPYLILRGTVFVRKHDSPVKTLSDFNGRKFAIVGINSIGEKFLRDYGLTPEKIYVNSSEEGLRAVDRGECAGVFVANLTALTVIDRAKLHNVVMFQEPFENYDIRHCFAVHKGDAQLLARLNEGLLTLQRTGEFGEIYDKWFGRFDSPAFSRDQVVTYGAGFLGAALLVALWGWRRQSRLSRRIAGQAEMLSGQQALLQALYDNIPQAMCVLELAPDGPRVLSINRQAETYLGVPAAGIVGGPWSRAPADSEWCAVVTELVHRHANEHVLIREERSLTAHRRRLFFIVVALSHGPHGARLCVLSEDVTERRNLDDEVAQSRRLRALGELVGGIAHEFNNLLTPVMLKVSELQLDHASDPRLQEDLGLITVTVRRAADLTRRLLAFGRKT
ncbi:MAG TPA: transporter substrate-binding domain-containing protein, partial [Candidatus Didemnitutus sp.]|nr:transporter substrate-binding domain-containing protein [Candidatus Didemnitutus sp.]